MLSNRSSSGREEEQTAKSWIYSTHILVFDMRKCGVGDQVPGEREELLYTAHSQTSWTCRAEFCACLRHVPCNESFEDAETVT